MNPETERLGEEKEMLAKQYPNFALNMQTRECTGQIFSHIPSTAYEITIHLPELYPEKPPHIAIDFPQNPIIDYFVDQEFHPSLLSSIAEWNSQQHLGDVIKELEEYIREKKEKTIAKFLKEKDLMSKKKPSFGFTEDFKKCNGKIFSKQVFSTACNVEIFIDPQFPEKPPKVEIIGPKDPLLAHWVDYDLRSADLPTLANWKKSSHIVTLVDELEKIIHSREKKAERVIQERDVLRKKNPTFGFTSDGTKCIGRIYSLLGQKVYQVTIALSEDFPVYPPNIIIVPPSDPLINVYVDTNFDPKNLEPIARWDPQTQITDIIEELHGLIHSREEHLLKRMVDERTLVRKNWPNFGFTSDMKECNGVVYVPSGDRYQVIITLQNFPQSAPTVRAEGTALPNQQLDLPVLRDWNPSVTMDTLLKATEMKIRQINLRHASINKELMDLRTFWRSLDFLPGKPQKARGSATIALPPGECNITLDIDFPAGYPETPPAITLNATGYKSNEIKKIETSVRRKISSSWPQYKKVSIVLKQLPEDLVTCLIGRDEITGVDFKEEVRRNHPIYYCKKCMNTPSKRICYFHKASLNRIIQRESRCIIYPHLKINETDVGELKPVPRQ